MKTLEKQIIKHEFGRVAEALAPWRPLSRLEWAQAPRALVPTSAPPAVNAVATEARNKLLFDDFMLTFSKSCQQTPGSHRFSC